MFTKSIITAAAAVTIAFAVPATVAQAKTNFDFNVNLGLMGPGYGYGYGYGDYEPVYNYGAISCHKGRQIVKWQGFNKVKSIDCSLPGYKYSGWKFGHKYIVRVNGAGDITSVKKVF